MLVNLLCRVAQTHPGYTFTNCKTPRMQSFHIPVQYIITSMWWLCFKYRCLYTHGQSGLVNRGGVWKKAFQLHDTNLLRSAVLLPGVAAFPEVMAVGGEAPAFLSSSSLFDPPEELLSEAMTGAFLPSPAGRAPKVALASAGTQRKKSNC